MRPPHGVAVRRQSPVFSPSPAVPGIVPWTLWLVAFLFLAAGARAQVTGTNAFASRQALTVVAGTASGTGVNTAANAEVGEPEHVGQTAVASLWWRWTPGSSGLAQIDTVGSTFYTRLAVYTGSTLAALVPVVGSALEADDFTTTGTSYSSVVRFMAQAGVSYAIVVDGYTYTDNGSTVTAKGTCSLNLTFPTAATGLTNDNFAGATDITSTSSATADVTLASVEATEPDPDPLGFAYGAGRSLWYRWTAPATGYYSAIVDTTASTTAWSPLVAVYIGNTLSALTLKDQGEMEGFYPADYDDGSTLTPASRLRSEATFDAVAGQVYRIQVASRAVNDQFVGEQGQFELSVISAVRPTNDDFASASDLGSGTTATDRSSLFGATRQTGEQQHLAAIGGGGNTASIWWKWIAPSAGAVNVDLRGSGGSTVLAVYRAPSIPATLGALVLVGGNDDFNYSDYAYTSSYAFTAVAGTTYYFAVSGYSLGSSISIHLGTGSPRAPFEAWLLGYPTLTGASALKSADPDGDGLSNLLELLLGTNPTVSSQAYAADAGKVPAYSVANGTLTFTAGYSLENIAGVGGGTALSAQLQSSTDVTSWTGTAGTIGTTTVSAPSVIGATPRFFRVRVTDTNP